MNPTEIRATLAQLGGGANKHLGQHFLIDKTALDAIVQAAEIKKGDRVLEVGPGLGVLTRELIEGGAKVTFIERDRRFFDYFNNYLSPALVGERSPTKVGGIEGLLGDAAKLDWDELMGSKSWKFVSNLPYAITSLALRKALYAKNPPKVVVVLIQREVAERLMTSVRGGKQSLLSLMAALSSSEMGIVRRVLPGAFWPPPKVDSAIVRIVPMSNVERRKLWGIEPEDVMAVAKKGFAHPRKLLQKNIGIKDDVWDQIVQSLNINQKARAEELNVEQWVELAKAITNS